MRKIFIFIGLLLTLHVSSQQLTVGIAGSQSIVVEESDEKIQNGDFSDGTNHWESYAWFSVASEQGVVVNGASYAWLLEQQNCGFTEGISYLVTFDVISMTGEAFVSLNDVSSATFTTTGSKSYTVVAGEEVIGGQVGLKSNHWATMSIVIDNFSVKAQ